MVNAELVLGWKERDGPPPPVPRAYGFGLPMVEAIASRQLGGTATLDWAPEGLCAEIRVPLNKVRRSV